MNTLRYKAEYSEQVISFLKEKANPVHLTSDVFLEIGKLSEEENVDKEKLNKLFKKTYTVMLIEDEKLIGLAGMDKEGYINIFAVCDNGKAQRLLLDALDRRAAKTEVEQLFVQPFDDARDVFKNHGYEPMNEGDDFNLIKKTAFKERLGLKPEDIKNYALDPSKKIIVEGKHSVFPHFFLGTNCFFMFLLITLTATEYRNAFAENDTNFIIGFIVFTLLFAVALSIYIAYFVRQARLKKQVLSMRVTNGVITSYTRLMTKSKDDGHFTEYINMPEYTRVYLTYEFYDENMVKREAKFTHRYRFSGPYFYEGQKLVVAHSEDKSYVLHSYILLNPYDEEEERLTDSSKVLTEKVIATHVPIKATKMYKGHALSYLIGCAILFAFFLIFGIYRVYYTGQGFGELLENLLFGLPFYGLLGAFALYAYFITLIEKRKYRRLLADPEVKCTQGKIEHIDKTFKSDNKMRFYCVFNDGKEKRKVLVPFRSSSNLVKSGKTSVLVVYNKTDAVVLVKKGVYPDKFVFNYYRN